MTLKLAMLYLKLAKITLDVLLEKLQTTKVIKDCAGNSLLTPSLSRIKSFSYSTCGTILQPQDKLTQNSWFNVQAAHGQLILVLPLFLVATFAQRDENQSV